jgi:dTDP-4-amino-4,6-dideoxygalactose transaminase
MKRRKILLQVHYIPIYLQSFYKKKFKYNLNDLKVSKEFYDHEVSLPIYYDLKVYEQKKVINSIKNILKI